MKPGSGRHDAAQETTISVEKLERLATPLTVLHANIQLLQRRIRQGNTPGPNALLHTLARLEQASRTLSAELRELHDGISTGRPVRETIEGNPLSAVHDREERDA